MFISHLVACDEVYPAPTACDEVLSRGWIAFARAMHMSHGKISQVALSDDFRIGKARELLSSKLPFVEGLIQQHMTSQLGLGAQSIAAMVQKEAKAQQETQRSLNTND